MVSVHRRRRRPPPCRLVSPRFGALSNQVFTSDITYIWTDEGWLYLAVVLDLFNREVVGWSIKPCMTADIVTDALTMAWFRRRPGLGAMLMQTTRERYGNREESQARMLAMAPSTDSRHLGFQ